MPKHMVLRAELKEHQLSYPTIRSQNFEASQVEKEVVWNFLPVFPQIYFENVYVLTSYLGLEITPMCFGLTISPQPPLKWEWSRTRQSGWSLLPWTTNKPWWLVAILHPELFGERRLGVKKSNSNKKTNHCGSSEAQTKIQLEFKVGSKQQAPHPKNITWKQRTKEWSWHDWLWICYPTRHSLRDHKYRSL